MPPTLAGPRLRDTPDAEVDGCQHADKTVSAHGAASTGKLHGNGWTVGPFGNHDVLADIDGVCTHIVIAARLSAEDAAQAGMSASTLREEART